MSKEEIKRIVESILREVAPYDGLKNKIHVDMAIKKYDLIADKVASRLENFVKQAVSSGDENGGHLSNSQVEKFIGVCFDCESFDDTGCDEYTGCCVEPKSERGGKIIFGDTKKCKYYRES